MEFLQYAFIDLFAALKDRDLCLECGGSGRNATEVDGEAEFEPCGCTCRADEVLAQYLPLFLEIFQEVLTCRVEEVSWDETITKDRLRGILEIVVNHYLNGYKTTSLLIDAENVVQLTIVKEMENTTPIKFKGNTFAEVFRQATSKTYEE